MNFFSNVKKIKLRSDFHFWCETLQIQFHENLAVTLRKFSELKYTHQNMQNQVSADVYIAKAIYYIIICNQIEYSVLLTAWQEINVKIQVYIL